MSALLTADFSCGKVLKAPKCLGTGGMGGVLNVVTDPFRLEKSSVVELASEDAEAME